MRGYQEKSFVKEVAYRGVDFQVGFDSKLRACREGAVKIKWLGCWGFFF